MQFKRGCAKGFLIGLALSLIPISALGAEKITPGSTCKVSQQKVTYLNRTFTCIKSGKKLIWNKGTLVTRPTPTPTPTMIAFLSAPPPNLGEITTKVECLNSPCIYNGPVPQEAFVAALATDADIEKIKAARKQD